MEKIGLKRTEEVISRIARLAAECHRRKWAYQDDTPDEPTSAAFDDLHYIGDELSKLERELR